MSNVKRTGAAVGAAVTGPAGKNAARLGIGTIIAGLALDGTDISTMKAAYCTGGIVWVTTQLSFVAGPLWKKLIKSVGG